MREKVKAAAKKEKIKAFSFKDIDLSIVFISIFLSILCLIFVYSALAFESSETKTFLNIIKVNFRDRTLLKSIFFTIVGLVIMFFVAGFNVKSLKESSPLLYSILTNPFIYYIVSCSFFVFIEIMKSIGGESGGEDAKSAIVGKGFLIKANGAYRWINIPGLNISFQPSEIAKLLLIIAFALAIYNAGMSLEMKRGILLFLAVAVVPTYMIFEFSSDLSSAIVVFLIIYAMIIVASPNVKNTITIAAILLLAAFIALIVIVSINHGKEEQDIHPYQAKRIMAWLYPEDYPASADQTNQAMYAIGSGGYFGEGIGNSMQKIKKLPEAQNDMIFALICEELGLVGGVSVILLYLVLLARMYMIAMNTDDLLDRMIVVGVLAHIALQVIINVCVVTRLFPNTGLPLPLISAGGSSIVFMYIEIGLVLNIGKFIERR